MEAPVYIGTVILYYLFHAEEMNREKKFFDHSATKVTIKVSTAPSHGQSYFL